MAPISFSSHPGDDKWKGNIISDHSVKNNQSMQLEIDNAPALYAIEPTSPHAPDYFPMLPEDDGFHSDEYNPDQEFQDRPEDADPRVVKEFPYHHLTYTCYPMRATDSLRRNFLNPTSNAFLRPGTKEDFPDGLRLVFINWLKKYDVGSGTGVSVGLWRTIGPDPLLVVIKRIKGYSLKTRRENGPRAANIDGPPGEIKFNSLPDETRRTLEFRFLYDPHLTCLPQTHAFQLHDWPQEDVTHFGKFYNGGSVAEMITKFKRLGKAVPEALIWHVIAQVGRAFKFIHMGRTHPDKTQERGSVRGPPEEGEKEREWMEREDARAANWVPTAHFDAHAVNVWMHWVTQYERENDRDKCLEHFDEDFPQVILGDFGLAMNGLSGIGSHNLRINECPDLPGKETWKDKAELGLMLHHLLLAGVREVPRFTSKEIPEDWYTQHNEWLYANYSKTLIDVVKRFSKLAHMSDRNRLDRDSFGGMSFGEMVEQEYKNWKDGHSSGLAPCDEWFHHTMIDLADKEVDERRRFRDGVESVRWATGQRMSTMPYQVQNRTKYSQKLFYPHVRGQVLPVPVNGRETLRSKARTLYNRKLRRPVIAAFYRHPPDPADCVDKDKLWVTRTYRMERIRYRKPQAIKIETSLKGNPGRKQTKFTPPPTPGEVDQIKSTMFGPSPWDSRVLQWDREGEGNGDESPGMEDWSFFGASESGS
ncbi:hypothetical protein QR685DRAFT_514033 [Neurospora intermedia]|uniref:Protein kinase domain-containing protein n=1 Tax=Neurospora intermedia TaxID=5142 RepID=A0ABR3DUC6_NEUIN